MANKSYHPEEYYEYDEKYCSCFKRDGYKYERDGEVGCGVTPEDAYAEWLTRI